MLRDADVVRAAAEGHLKRTAAEVATGEPVAVAPGDPLWRAAQTMAGRRATHVLVVDNVAGRPVGVLSSLDIALAAGAAG